MVEELKKLGYFALSDTLFISPTGLLHCAASSADAKGLIAFEKQSVLEVEVAASKVVVADLITFFVS